MDSIGANGCFNTKITAISAPVLVALQDIILIPQEDFLKTVIE